MLERIRQSTESATLSRKQREFLNDLEDNEYRNLFAGELVGTSLAFQIRRLRDARGFTQDELAQLADKKQETISQWENPDYGRYTLSTLKTLAGAFDVGLLVRFVSFSELADWTIDVSPERLTPPSYEEELSFAAVHDSLGPSSWGNLRTLGEQFRRDMAEYIASHTNEASTSPMSVTTDATEDVTASGAAEYAKVA